MISALVLTAMLAAAPPQPASPTLQDPPPANAAAIADTPTDLDDVQVVGRPLDTMIRSFVSEVAAPNRYRGIARWESNICIGVANLRAEPAQYLVDRISTVAENVGLNPGAPGCSPNVIIVASDKPDEITQAMVEERHRAFRMGGTGMDRGGDAFEDFIQSDRPVRWWQVSMPVDSETGKRAARIDGDCQAPCNLPIDYAPIINVAAASRLNQQVVDTIIRTVIVLDMNKIEGLSTLQLADYIAMITLAQINPDAETNRYASILNVFDDPETVETLTNWDLAYLDGLYSAERNRIDLRANRSEIVSSIQDAHTRLQSQDPG